MITSEVVVDSELIGIPCPSCGEAIARVGKETIRRARCLGVHCDCGFTD